MSGRGFVELIELEAVRYGIVGASSLASYAAVNVLLAGVFGVWPAIAAGVAVCASAALNFVGHAWFTFRSERPLRSSLPRYVAVVFLNAGLAASLVGIGVEILAIHAVAANAISLVVVTVTTFFLLKHGVMSAPTRRADTEATTTDERVKVPG